MARARRYFQNWKNVEDVHESFGGACNVKDAEVLFAWYGYGDCCGSGQVIYQRDGKLYEVSGGHCSCYGLEGQWSPAEVSWDQLAMRPPNEYGSYGDDSNAARDAFNKLVRRHVPRA